MKSVIWRSVFAQQVQRQRQAAVRALIAVGLVILTLATATPARADGDSTAPVLVGLEISPSSVDVSSSDAIVVFSLRITDDAAGFSYAGLTVKGPSGQIFGDSVHPNNRVSGSALDGVYEVQFSVPRSSPAGTWTLDQVSMLDAAANSRTYSNSAMLTNAGFPTTFQVVSTTSDSTAPALAGLEISPSSVDVSSADAVVVFSLRITDDGSGFSYASLTVKGPSGQIFGDSVHPNNRVSGSALDGVYEVQFSVPRSSPAGTWTLDQVSMLDAAANSRTYSNSAMLTNAGFPTTFQVVSASSDSMAPVLVGLEISPASVDVSSTNAFATFRFHLTDDIAGFASGSLSVRGPSGQLIGDSIQSFSRVSGDAFDGVYEVQLSIAKSSESGTWKLDQLTLRDKSSNSRTYPSSAALMNAGFPTDISVSNTPATTTTTSTTVASQPLRITATLDPPANEYGWHIGTTDVNYTCSGGSGTVTCPPQAHFTTEGDRVVTATATDSDGHTASVSTNVRIDMTGANVSTALSPAPVIATWRNNVVTVDFTCSDELSGIAECPEDRTITTEGDNSVAWKVVDKAGNTSYGGFQVFIDYTPPQLTTTVSPEPNAAGWANQTVSVTHECSDALSGLLSCPPSRTFADEGNYSFRSDAFDRAYNNTYTEVTVNIDKTKPRIEASLSSTPNDAGWHRGAVTVHFTCQDDRSGIASCPADQVVDIDGARNVTGTATDKAGNSSSVSVLVNLDRGKPTITSQVSPAPNAAGWLRSNATITYACLDATSGVAACPESDTLSSSGSTVRQAVDVAGNSSDVLTTVVKIDTTSPSIRWEAERVPDTASGYTRPVTLRAICADALSGVSLCPASRTISGEGSFTVSGTSYDVAGNSATASTTVQIDMVGPVITPTFSGTIGANGWFISNATVTYACSDAGFGVKTCPARSTVSRDGETVVAVSATDKAGNSSQLKLTVRVDKTKPSGTIVAPARNTISASQPLTGTAKDATAGVRMVTVTFGSGQSTLAALSCDANHRNCTWQVPLPSKLGSQTARVTVTDLAGNSYSSATSRFTVRS